MDSILRSVTSALLLLVLLCLADQTAAAVALVQAKDARSQAGGTTAPVTWTSNTTTGNLQVGGVTYGSSTDIITTISDGTNTFTKIQTCSDTTHGQSITSFYKENATGGTTPTITVTFSAATSFTAVAVHEVSGVATSASLDKFACQWQTAPGTGTDGVTSGTTAPPASGDYEFSVTQDSAANAATHTAGTGYTLDTNGSSADVDFASEHLAGGTTNAGTWTSNLDQDHITNFAAFKAASGGGPTCPKTLLLMGVGC